MLEITICPTCGSNKIRSVRKDQKREFNGQPYTVPDLEYQECPVCGEEIYGPDAVKKIETYSPAFAKPKTQQVAA
ncbi:MAG: YgiT-type zinc finger protein [Acidobacteria bacterium]|nr:YgiT-type zinc finger protein [Acidobacteriota bacterium]